LKSLSSLLFNIFFFLIGIFLLWLAFRNQDFGQLMREVGKLDYRWGVIVLIISFLNSWVRALRWRLLILPIQRDVRADNTFWAMMFGYLVNLAIPRLGEVSRCWALHRTDKVAFAPLLGTMVTERVVDVLSLLLVTLLVFVFQFDLIFGFFQAYILPTLQTSFNGKESFLFFLLASGLIFGGLGWHFRQEILKINFLKPILNFLGRIWEGIISIRQMPHRAWFVAYTVFIWFTYHLMTYFWFFSIAETSHLGVGAGFLLLSVATFSRLVPIQAANMGAYHYLVIKGFILLGISELAGATLAFVIHFAQIIYTLVFGGISIIVIFYLNRPKV
jgi:glycosyltransferase 2 family protein